jgi:hypothetical protein
MKHLKIAGLCMVSMFVMGMALAANASAAPLWLVCLEGTNLTKYSSNQCTKAEAGGKWQSQGLTTSDKITDTGFTLTLADTKTALGKTVVRCNAAASAKIIQVATAGTVESVTVAKPSENCRGIEGGCESVEKIEAVDLPWQTVLFETEKKTLTQLKGDGKGEPGVAITCKTVLGSKTDTCKSEEGKPEETLLENKLSGTVLLVLGTFMKKHKGTCTEGGKESGEVEGQIAILLESGNGFSVNPN